MAIAKQSAKPRVRKDGRVTYPVQVLADRKLHREFKAKVQAVAASGPTFGGEEASMSSVTMALFRWFCGLSDRQAAEWLSTEFPALEKTVLGSDRRDAN